MSDAAYRVEVMHGVNLNMLEHRNPAHYGTPDGRALTLAELEQRIDAFAAEFGLRARFFQTNSEAAFVERLHLLREDADGIVLNPGAWTHYAWAIHDALELAALPAVEVHLSDVKARDPWRRISVIEDLCVASVCGQGVEGYRLGLQRLRAALDGERA
jgi:3-dehydroquinate dehydratase II